ncbi:electron transport complex subunit RsxE [Feifania hominis]|uniref:Ion-translocating oxidoreductase complex subunit E n=1 Tax=Feifania hominis TaxID=2763660 RepID=A0A926DDV3_9FIRM|nr:electron transport complex subunit E [Feifania hominis]MBC8536386.1 electron transport complex subunit E [Feifania hominis]
MRTEHTGKPGRKPSSNAALLRQLANGVIYENPTLVQLLGMCPTLATTTSIANGLGMGLAATAVLICSNIVISALRRLIPSKIRIAAYVVIIAGFVTAVDLLLQAFLPGLSSSLGLFIPLIVVNCIILARAEAFASKNPVGKSAVDGLAMGLGFTLALVVLSAVRELLGAGTLFGVHVFGEGFKPALLMGLPPGGFLALGGLIALVQYLMQRKGARKHG